MSDERAPFNPTAISFAHLRRAELPLSHGPALVRDADLSKEAFLEARRGSPRAPEIPERFAGRDSEGRSGRTPKTLKHVLPEPRPDFAPPNRKLFEEDWLWRRRRYEPPDPVVTRSVPCSR